MLNDFDEQEPYSAKLFCMQTLQRNHFYMLRLEKGKFVIETFQFIENVVVKCRFRKLVAFVNSL